MASRRTDSIGSIPFYTQSTTTSRGQHRPLIEQCTNEWRNKETIRESTSSNTDSGWLDSLALTFRQGWAITKAPKFQRLAVMLILVTMLTVFAWRHFLSVFVAENEAALGSMDGEGEARHGNLFGANKRVNFPGMTHISTMNSEYLPRISKLNHGTASKGRRLVFIGDIHGCKESLEALLAEVKYNPKKDHIIALGDMINKGPNSRGVVDLLMAQGASCVRGNHEDRLLLIAKEMDSGPLTAQKSDGDRHDVESESKAARKNREEQTVVKTLTQKQLDWLNKCPVILRVGRLGSYGEVVAVHGGLVPGIRLENQDPVSVMSMRIVDLATHMPSHKHEMEGSVPWAKFWNMFEGLLPTQRSIFNYKKHNSKHTTVVFGHDSRRGLQIDSYTKGLDSGCVNGNKLTAWVVGDYGKEEFVQVKCREQRA